MGKIKLNSWSGYLSSDELKDWLENSLSKQFNSACSLIEYVHRFKLACKNKLVDEIKKDYCLKGRIFWPSGQIFFRRIEPDKFQFLVVSEDSNPNLVDGLNLTHNNEEFEIRDKNVILWGTYDEDINGYREERVSGYSGIDYPPEIGNKKYPILVIREYINKEGNVVLWRFLGLSSKDSINYDGKEVFDERAQEKT